MTVAIFNVVYYVGLIWYIICQFSVSYKNETSDLDHENFLEVYDYASKTEFE